MKAVILLAGIGRRMNKKHGDLHKSLIHLHGKPLLFYLVENIRLAGITEIVPVLGYKADEILEYMKGVRGDMHIIPVYNPDYEKTNNLHSLLCAEDKLKEEFVLCNGDMVYDYRILEKLIHDGGSRIAVDNQHKDVFIDSPCVKIEEKILDLGRHIDWKDGDGYAIGVYKFGKDIIYDFFKRGHDLCRENINHGFHDPLRALFHSHSIMPSYVGDYLWTDIDEEEDVSAAGEYLGRLMNDYR